MPTYQISLKELREMARKNSTFIKLKNLNLTKFEEAGGRIIGRNPLTLSYGSYTYVIAKNHIELSVPEVPEGNPEAWLTFRLASMMGTTGMTEFKKLFVMVRRAEWVGKKLVHLDRKIKDTDTLSEFPAFEEIIEIAIERILRYVLRYNRKLTKNELIRNMSRIANIETRRVAQKIESMIAGKLIEVVRIQVYLDVSDEVIMLLIPEGLPYTGMIKEAMRRFGWTRRRSVDAWFLAYEKGYIKESKRRLYLAKEGREVLSRYIKRERVKLEDRIAITKKGIDRIFK